MESGIPDEVVADKAMRLTLSILGQRLMDDEALALSANLEGELARIVEQSEYSDSEGAFDASEFYERVRRAEETPPAAAREHVNVVLESLGAAIDDELRTRLIRALPKPIGDQLVPAQFGEPAAYAEPVHAPRIDTLAQGRPGSRHPLAEAAPPSGQTHSVARNEDPHAETKLSSAQGLTQERLGDSLAAGRPPGPERPVAEAKDK